MIAFLDELQAWFLSIDWFRTLFNAIVFVVAVVLAIWLPGKALEYHTNQRGVRYIWYVVSGCVLVMIYLCMYGYGRFWESDWRTGLR